MVETEEHFHTWEGMYRMNIKKFVSNTGEEGSGGCAAGGVSCGPAVPAGPWQPLRLDGPSGGQASSKVPLNKCCCFLTKAQCTYICRVQSCVSRLPKHWPTTPLSTQRVCPPPAPKAGGSHSPGGEGGGGSTFWETHDIGLASYTIVSLRAKVFAAFLCNAIIPERSTFHQCLNERQAIIILEDF